MDKENFQGLINQAKSSNKTKPLQKVVPIKVKENEEVQFSFYIEKQLLKKTKLKALENDVSIKSLINEAIKYFLEKGK